MMLGRSSSIVCCRVLALACGVAFGGATGPGGASTWAVADSNGAAGARKDAAPQWIWAAGDDRLAAGQTVQFQRWWHAEATVRAAHVRLVADHCRVTLRINGHDAGTFEDYRSARSVDVSRFLVAGDNTLSLQATAGPGPSAIACEFAANLETGGKPPVSVLLRSDAEWTAWVVPSSKTAAGHVPSGTAPSTPGTAATLLGTVGWVRFGRGPSEPHISAFDNYGQWKQAIDSQGATDASAIAHLPAYEVELVRSAAADEGSWISLAFTPSGHLIVSREDQGLLRMTFDEQGQVANVAEVESTLQECRGLQCDLDALWANANNSKALYRLPLTPGGKLSTPQVVYQSTGGVGHGRNDIAWGPDSRLYVIHGDSVRLPPDVISWLSPVRHAGADSRAGEGHVLRFSKLPRAPGAPGSAWEGKPELIVAGLRNPYGIALNRDGEMFTYDADAEFDMGSSWYRPTRVLHLLPGGDYGWRAVTGSWPPYFCDRPDNAPVNLDIGKGSPTAAEFGYISNFPENYREALYVLDWAYGRVLAVHMEPLGASYAMRAETFLRGQPLNVTDLTFGPDGAMYLITGGRRTQSGLYRIRYGGPELPSGATPTAQQAARRKYAANSRTRRRRLESLIRPRKNAPIPAATACDQVWPCLGQPDPWLAYTARSLLEHQPVEHWAERALAEEAPANAVPALLALARAGNADHRAQLLQRLPELPWDDLTESQKQQVIQAYRLCLAAHPDDVNGTTIPREPRDAVANHLRRLYPDASWQINRPLVLLLAELSVDGLVEDTLALLEQTDSPVERFHYLFALRNVRSGWNDTARRQYFNALRDAESFLGGEGMPGFLQKIRQEALSHVRTEDRETLALLLAGSSTSRQLPTVIDRPFVRHWSPDDMSTLTQVPASAPDHGRGRQAFVAALCIHCHRVAGEGAAVGPDLTAVGNRFSRRDLLRAILNPSEVIADSYRQDIITTHSGQTIVGRVAPGGDYRSEVLRFITNPMLPHQTLEVPKSDVEARQALAVSPMPTGLLDTLTAKEIGELLSYLQAGGDPQHAIYSSVRSD